MGVNHESKLIEVEGKLIKLEIWDGSGSERYCHMIKNYYRSIHGIIIVYDVTDYNSFESITNYWLNDIEENAPQNIIKVLVGNKCDKPNRVVTEEEGKKLAENNCMSFFETSAKSGLNVDEVFFYITKQILKKFETLEKVPIKKESKSFFNFFFNKSKKKSEEKEKLSVNKKLGNKNEVNELKAPFGKEYLKMEELIKKIESLEKELKEEKNKNQTLLEKIDKLNIDFEKDKKALERKLKEEKEKNQILEDKIKKNQKEFEVKAKQKIF